MSAATTSGSAVTRSSGEECPQFKVVFVIGGPGAGKSSLCRELAEQLSYHHISTGDYLRKLAKAGDATGTEGGSPPPVEQAYAGLTPADLSDQMRKSALIREDIIVRILLFRLQELYEKDGSLDFIIDGFPRTVESANAWETEVGKPVMTLRVHTKQETARAWFLARGRESGDTAEKHETRQKQFDEHNGLIEELYVSQGLLKRVYNDDTFSGAGFQARKALASVARNADRAAQSM
ncbi:UMP-CMP kinase [Microdochium nivale]|nr:UMP-CMP kinase [Microdochium nivale]